MKILPAALCAIFVLTNCLVFGQVVKGEKFSLSLGFVDGVFKEPPSSSFYGYEAKEWLALIDKYPFDSPRIPDLAWKTGSTLEALFFLYEMTADEEIAEFYLSLTDDLMNTRDDKKGVVAWDGGSHKYWSSGNRYNYGYINLYDKKNQLKGILELKDAKLDECFISIELTNEHDFSIAIENKRDGGKYHLENSNFESLENDINTVKWNSYVSNNEENRVLNYISIDKKQAMARTINQQRISSYYVPSIDVNAINLIALVNAYNILLNKNMPEKAKKYFSFIEETTEENNNIFLNENDTSCHFQYPKNSKTFMGGGVVYPYNKQFAYVAMLSKWNKIAQDDRINELIEKWSSYFKSILEETDLGVTWRYWADPTNTIIRYETENYGGHDIKYLMTIAENSKAFSADDVLKITKAVRENLLLCEGDEVFHKTTFDFKWRDKGLVDINYLSLGKFWPEVFSCYEMHINVSKLHWIDRVRMIYYFKKREK